MNANQGRAAQMRSAKKWVMAIGAATACLMGGASSLAANATPTDSPAIQEFKQSSDGTLDLSAFKGKVVYLDFWASWCGPCKQSFPWMMDVQRRYGDKGLVVVTVNLDKDRELAHKFLKQFNPSFPIVFDAKGRVAEQYKITGMPSSFMIERDGKVHSSHVGFRTDQQAKLEDELRSLLR